LEDLGASATGGVPASEQAVAPGATPQAVRPVGPMRSIILAQAVFQKDRGAVVAVDANGDVWAYPGAADGRLGSPTKIGAGFAGEELQIVDKFPAAWGAVTTTDFLGLTCSGDLYMHRLGYSGSSPLAAQKIGNGWADYLPTMAGELLPSDGPGFDVVAVNKTSGDLFLYKYRWDLYHPGNPPTGFMSPYPKVGNGWKDWKLIPAGDVNRDGLDDIMGIDQKGDLYYYRGLGTGYFGTKVKVGNGWGDFDIASGVDVDGNGTADIMGRSQDGRLFFYQGLGNGKFATRVQVGNDWGPLDSGPDCGVTATGQMGALPWREPRAVGWALGG
jgi:hypothetical protein